MQKIRLYHNRGLPQSNRVIVVSGPGCEPIDSVRCITNHSTGELGAMLCASLAKQGFDVVCMEGKGATSRCSQNDARIHKFASAEDLLTLLARSAKEPEPFALFHVAALGDFRVLAIEDSLGRSMTGGKLPSRGGRVRLILEPAPKVIAQLRDFFPHSLLVGWKFEVEGPEESVVAKGVRQINENNTDACVLNGGGFGPGFGFLQCDGQMTTLSTKAALSEFLSLWLCHRRIGAHPNSKTARLSSTIKV